MGLSVYIQIFECNNEKNSESIQRLRYTVEILGSEHGANATI